MCAMLAALGKHGTQQPLSSACLCSTIPGLPRQDHGVKELVAGAVEVLVRCCTCVEAHAVDGDEHLHDVEASFVRFRLTGPVGTDCQFRLACTAGTVDQ